MIPDGHPVGWDHSAVPVEGWVAAPPVAPAEEDNTGAGWENDVPEETSQHSVFTPPSGSVASPEPASVPASSSAPAGSVSNANATSAHITGMRMMLEALGGVPEAILNSNSAQVMNAYLQGRMYSNPGSGG